MTLAIGFYYDRSTPKNVRESDEIVSTFASRGIAFEYSLNNFVEKDLRGRPILIIDGIIFGVEQIERDSRGVLYLAQKVDLERRKRELRDKRQPALR